MTDTSIEVTENGRVLGTNKFTRAGEIFVVFIAGIAVIWSTGAMFGDNPIAYLGGIWAANLLMLVLVFLGLRLRGESCAHFGLVLRLGSRRSIIRGVLQSFAVFVAAITAFVFGAILMANIVGMPEAADMSRYDGLRGNLTMTILALMSVYIISTFAEEVIYRGFLITRITELGAGTKTSVWSAIAVSSVVFGMVHSDWGLAGMVQASLMGLALGVSYILVGRNLWVTILAHGYMDTILILQMYFASG